MKNSRKSPTAWVDRHYLSPKDPKKVCRVCPRCQGKSEQGSPENAEVLSLICDDCFHGLSATELAFFDMIPHVPDRAAHYGIYPTLGHLP